MCVCVCVSSMSNPRVGDDLPASQSAGLPGGSCQSSGPPHGNITYITPRYQRRAKRGEKEKKREGKRKDPSPHPQPLISDL